MSRSENEKVNHALWYIQKEVDNAMRKHPPMNSHHEAYGVLLEEVEEFWDEVKKKDSARDPLKTRGELIQVAAMAVRALVDLELV